MILKPVSHENSAKRSAWSRREFRQPRGLNIAAAYSENVVACECESRDKPMPKLEKQVAERLKVMDPDGQLTKEFQ